MAFYRAFTSGARLRDHNDDVNVLDDDDGGVDHNFDDGDSEDEVETNIIC